VLVLVVAGSPARRRLRLSCPLACTCSFPCSCSCPS